MSEVRFINKQNNQTNKQSIMENVPADVVPDNGPRKRGRPKKVTVAVASGFDGPKRGVGRPRKTAAVVHSDGSMVVEGEGVRKVVEGEAVRGKVGEGEAVKRKVGQPSTGWKEEREASKARMAAKRARKEFEVEKRAYLKRTDQAEFRGERMSRQEAQRLKGEAGKEYGGRGGRFGVDQGHHGVQQGHHGVHQGHHGVHQGHHGLLQGHHSAGNAHFGVDQGHHGHLGGQLGQLGGKYGHLCPKEAQQRGQEKAMASRAARSEARRSQVGEAPELSSAANNVDWTCDGELEPGVFCSFYCIIKVNLLSLIDLSELTLLMWIVGHGIMDSSCNRVIDGIQCPGTCEAIAQSRDPNKVSLLCPLCHYESKVKTI